MIKWYEVVPAGSVFFAFLLTLIGAPLLLPLIFVFHWGIYRFDIIPISFVFIIGLIQSVLGGVWVGEIAFWYILVLIIAQWNSSYFSQSNFLQVWVGFLVVSTFISLVRVVLIRSLGHEISMFFSIWQGLELLLLYPVCIYLISFLHQRFPRFQNV